jgi:polyphosphate kinase
MFEQTNTTFVPWTVVKSNDKKRARLNAMRHVLQMFGYPRRDDVVVGSDGLTHPRTRVSGVRTW